MIKDFFAHYSDYHQLVASTQLVLAMFGMGLVTRLRSFIEVIVEPKPIIAGLLYQLIGIPLITAGMMALLDLPPEIVVGFFMVAAMPGGSMSNIYTHLGKGNVALSVALTGVMTLLALFTSPLILRLFASEHIPPEIAMPSGVIIREIFLFLLLPLSFGMLLGSWMKKNIAHWSSVWIIRASLVALATLVIGSLGSGSIDFESYGRRIPILVFGYCLLVQIIILRGSRHLLKFSATDSSTLGIESSMKNINLSLLIAASLFGLDSKFGGGVLFVLLLYGGVSLFVAAVPAIANARQSKKTVS
ncbi:MAG: bile acid:sodium symporter [Verrucomicrobiales bacterium]|nr:bile acid:sodium symporter [Verrucomicrobiales bacterium]